MMQSRAAIAILCCVVLTTRAEQASCSYAGQSEAEVEAAELGEAAALDVRLLQSRAQALMAPGAASVAVGGDGSVTEETALMQGALAVTTSEPYACAGDGSPSQNPNCAMNPSRSGCTWSPGCNWNGESHFDGWCVGSSSCVYTSGEVACQGMVGCSWTKAARPINMTAEQEADARDGERTARDIKAATDALRAVALCQGDGTELESPYCKFVPDELSCKFAPGCNWKGQSAYGGWCTGGMACFQELAQGLCDGAPGCKWVGNKAAAPAVAPAAAPAVAPAAAPAALAQAPVGRVRAPGACTGDGTPTQNPNCIFNPTRSGCTWSPGCNWEGESHFDGWCSGSLACVYTSNPQICASSGCAWVAAKRPVNRTAEREMDVAGAKTAAETIKATDDAARQTALCQGGGGIFENPWCKYIQAQAYCMITPGCNFQGMSSFGGWCRGTSPLCANQPAPFACAALVGCEWATATATYTGQAYSATVAAPAPATAASTVAPTAAASTTVAATPRRGGKKTGAKSTAEATPASVGAAVAPPPVSDATPAAAANFTGNGSAPIAPAHASFP